MTVLAPTNISILPSVLAMDYANLAQNVATAEKAGANALHCDIMDGHFVPNISFGPDMVAALKRITNLPLDVHLMLAKPTDFIERFTNIGVQAISVHGELPEAELLAALRQIKAANCQVGLALNPSTPLSAVPEAAWPLLDRLLVMTVQAGFGGQTFQDMSAKIVAAKAMHPQLIIQVDGGINTHTAPVVAKAGATEFVAGNYLFAQGLGQVAAHMASLKHAVGL